MNKFDFTLVHALQQHRAKFRVESNLIADMIRGELQNPMIRDERSIDWILQLLIKHAQNPHQLLLACSNLQKTVDDIVLAQDLIDLIFDMDTFRCVRLLGQHFSAMLVKLCELRTNNSATITFSEFLFGLIHHMSNYSTFVSKNITFRVKLYYDIYTLRTSKFSNARDLRVFMSNSVVQKLHIDALYENGVEDFKTIATSSIDTLRGSQLTDELLELFPNVTDLTIEHCATVTKCPPTVQILRLNSSTFTNDGLIAASQLQHLLIKNAPEVSICPPSITHLVVGNSAIDDLSLQMPYITNLKYLDISNRSDITFCPASVQMLIAKNSGLNDEGLQNVPNLTHMNVVGCLGGSVRPPNLEVLITRDPNDETSIPQVNRPIASVDAAPSYVTQTQTQTYTVVTHQNAPYATLVPIQTPPPPQYQYQLQSQPNPPLYFSYCNYSHPALYAGQSQPTMSTHWPY